MPLAISEPASYRIGAIASSNEKTQRRRVKHDIEDDNLYYEESSSEDEEACRIERDSTVGKYEVKEGHDERRRSGFKSKFTNSNNVHANEAAEHINRSASGYSYKTTERKNDN